MVTQTEAVPTGCMQMHVVVEGRTMVKKTDEKPKRASRIGPKPPDGSDTIQEFCDSERISLSQYFAMKREGWGPEEARVGARVIITPEAKAKWRREREAAARAGIGRAVPHDFNTEQSV
jgi:hypothetical protein